MQESDWPQVARLIELEWEKDHPVLDREFFFWQHSGYGDLSGIGATVLAFASNQLVGMRGIIPGVYQVPGNDGEYSYVSGGSFAMWIVQRESRGMGVGGQLLRHCERVLPVMVALGSNEETSVPIYLKYGFSRQQALHHWFRVLDEKGLFLIYGEDSSHTLVKPVERFEPTTVREIYDPKIATELWSKFSEKHRIFGLHRTEDFWNWRYLQHPTFLYRIFVDKNLETLAVTRIETVVEQGVEIKVLRILELFSSADTSFESNGIRRTAQFVEGLLLKESGNGISAADFRCSNVIMASSLKLAGFSFREMETNGRGKAGFAGQLNPTIRGPRPINLHWKISHQIAQSDGNGYFVKSDNDMDRPNSRGVRSPNLG